MATAQRFSPLVLLFYRSRCSRAETSSGRKETRRFTPSVGRKKKRKTQHRERRALLSGRERVRFRRSWEQKKMVFKSVRGSNKTTFRVIGNESFASRLRNAASWRVVRCTERNGKRDQFKVYTLYYYICIFLKKNESPRSVRARTGHVTTLCFNERERENPSE